MGWGYEIRGGVGSRVSVMTIILNKIGNQDRRIVGNFRQKNRILIVGSSVSFRQKNQIMIVESSDRR